MPLASDVQTAWPLTSAACKQGLYLLHSDALAAGELRSNNKIVTYQRFVDWDVPNMALCPLRVDNLTKRASQEALGTYKAALIAFGRWRIDLNRAHQKHPVLRLERQTEPLHSQTRIQTEARTVSTMPTARLHRRQISSYSSSSPEEETAKRVHRELLRAHVLTTTTHSEEPQQPSSSSSSSTATTTPPSPAHLALSRALTHTELAIVLAQYGCSTPEHLDTDLNRALLTKASLLRRLGLRRQSAAVEVATAARAEGLVIDGHDGILVGGADLNKVLALWEEEQNVEEGGGGGGGRERRETLSFTYYSGTHDIRGFFAGTGAAVPATIGQDVDDNEDPYWDHALSCARKRAGTR